MKFAVITHIIHKKQENLLYSYEPYVREMNLWFKYVNQVKVVGAFSKDKIDEIDSVYQHKNLILEVIPSIDITTVFNGVKALLLSPIICFKIVKTMFWADHIHLRCPSNIGLLSSCIQIFFPSKPKTVKYAGNWDPNSKQPWSYRLQKKILSNRFLSKNIKVLVYGEWKNQTKNIVPFFTASYSDSEIVEIPNKPINSEIKFIYVGGLTKGKQPLKSLKVIHQLINEKQNVRLDFYGDGVEREKLEVYIAGNNMSNFVRLHGNVSKNEVKLAFQKSHFLMFLSKSEGWPKVVAEAMFWGCVPITTAVSCIPYILDNGNRGTLVHDNVKTIIEAIYKYINNPENYQLHSDKGMQWSRTFTLDKFESEIRKLLKH